MSKARSRRDNGAVLHTFTGGRAWARHAGRGEEAQRKRWEESRQTETVTRIKLRKGTKTGMATRRWKKNDSARKKIEVAFVRGDEAAKEVNYWTEVPMMFN